MTTPDQAAKKRGVVELRATITTGAAHDLERYVADIERQFANRFSCYVHELYPDAIVTTEATVTEESSA